MNNIDYTCCCGKKFKHVISLQVHTSRKCDGGKKMQTCIMEKIKSKPLDLFVEEYYIHINELFYNQNQFDKFRDITSFLIKLNKNVVPYYISDKNNTLVKGWGNLCSDKKNDDKEKDKEKEKYIDYNWSRISSNTFLDKYVDLINKKCTNINDYIIIQDYDRYIELLKSRQ